MRRKKAVPISHEQREAADQLMRDAVRTLLEGLPCRPEPRRQFDRVLSDERMTPWAPLVAMLATVAHAGQSADHLAALGQGLIAVALLLSAPPSLDAVATLHRETVEDARADLAQARAWAEGTPSAYGAAADASLRLARVQQETAHVLLHLAHPRAARPAQRPSPGLAA
jgi:hypothetical protein